MGWGTFGEGLGRLTSVGYVVVEIRGGVGGESILVYPGGHGLCNTKSLKNRTLLSSVWRLWIVCS